MLLLAPETCACPYGDPGPSMATSAICGGYLFFMGLLESYVNGRCDLADPCNRVKSREYPNENYDFIVVGGGTAGPIIASRLSEDPSVTVLLIEAGGDEPVASSVPSFYRSYWNNPSTDWMYRTQPQPNACLDQKEKGCMWPRGKMLGGTGVLNGMMYHRGHAADYEDWVKLGADGWTWEEVIPYFYKSEDNKGVGVSVNGSYHAVGGPMPVQHFKFQPELARDILVAVDSVGIPVISDMNDPNTENGFNYAQAFNDDGSRYTTSRGYLRPASGRPNLHVLLHSQVTKVLISEELSAYAVKYIRKGETKTVNADKEVILSAGALNSPQLLMLSGIGPKDTLSKYNIPVLVDLPEVGQNLQNHIGVNFYFRLEGMKDDRVLDWSTAMQYILDREGIMSSTGITQVTGLLYSSIADIERRQPDLQFFFNGLYAECSETGAVGEPTEIEAQKHMNISVTGISVLPRSTGYLTLNSADPLDPPLFHPNYFDHPDDMVMLKDAADIIHRIVNSDILKSKWGIRTDLEFASSCLSKGPEWSPAYVECMAQIYTDPQNHQCGTAAIGRVIDPRLKVYGVSGLRVIDASSIPQVPTGNPMAVIMMIAERGSDIIKQDWNLDTQ